MCPSDLQDRSDASCWNALSFSLTGTFGVCFASTGPLPRGSDAVASGQGRVAGSPRGTPPARTAIVYSRLELADSTSSTTGEPRRRSAIKPGERQKSARARKFGSSGLLTIRVARYTSGIMSRQTGSYEQQGYLIATLLRAQWHHRHQRLGARPERTLRFQLELGIGTPAWWLTVSSRVAI